MTENEAVSLFKRQLPDLVIGAIGDEGAHYILEAINPELTGEIDPYYAIDKRTGEISYYVPDDIISFGKIMGYDKDS